MWVLRDLAVRPPIGTLGIRRPQSVRKCPRLAQAGGDPLGRDRVGKPRRITDQKDAAVSHRLRAVPKGTDRRYRTNEVGLAQPRPDRLRDRAVARLELTAELTHAVLVTEQRDHSLVVRNRTFIDFEASVE